MPSPDGEFPWDQGGGLFLQRDGMSEAFELGYEAYGRFVGVDAVK